MYILTLYFTHFISISVKEVTRSKRSLSQRGQPVKQVTQSKTTTSHRIIPLVGASLWAAQRIKQNGSDYAFPRYTDGIKCNSNSASAALNKWIKQVARSGNVIHGFRHSFRDRLRAVSAPIDMIDQLGGWSLQTVGQGYGDGYDLVSLMQVMSQLQRNLEPDHSS